MKELELIQDEIISSLVKRESDILESFLRDNAVPKIKGKLTKGKLKWRGISLHQLNKGFNKPIERQLFQRGKPISPLIVITFPSFNNFINGN
jgi:hypothetical protein